MDQVCSRGQTQALSACTLAPLGEHQIIDGLGWKSATIHPPLQFPQFSVGSTGRRLSRASGNRTWRIR